MAGQQLGHQLVGDWHRPIQQLIAAGDFDRAVAHCRALKADHPRAPELDYFLGLSCIGAGHSAAAVVALADVLKAQPDHIGALCALGAALQSAGRLEEALGYLELATRFHPAAMRAWVARGGVLLALGRNDEAEDAFVTAVDLAPDDGSALAGFGTAAQRKLRYELAESAFRKVLERDPDNAMVRGNLGALLSDTLQQAEAQRMLAAAVALKPDDPVLISNRLFAALYDEDAADDAVVGLHRQLGAAIPAERVAVDLSERDCDPERPLVVGYLSPDFRRHPVGFFLHDVFPAHDRGQVRVVAFHDTTRRDWMTERLQTAVDDWRPVAGMKGPALAAQIAGAGVDVLIDMTGHTQANRLPLFAARVAPVQLSWAGYPGTTGVPAMDGVLVDRYLAEAAAPQDYTETLIGDLPVYACYAPPDYAPPIQARPDDGPVVFGCFANAAKINRRTATLWGRVMARVPDAHLVVKTHAIADAATRDRLAALLKAAGIPDERFTLEGPSPHDVLLGRLGTVDLVLDCAPYSGSTTVMEALWMGVPVVTRTGRLYHQRHGGAVLHAAGLDELIAETDDAYVDVAVALAQDAARRRQLRSDLRGIMERSPLRDGAGMARALEQVFRRLWRDWCRQTTRQER